MEERLPPPAPTKGHPSLPLPPAAAHVARELETYVVQIPRDQIHRVPPPEHARIVESHHNRLANNPAKHHRKTFCYATVISILLVSLAIITIVAIRATLYNPMPLAFTVVRVQAKNLENASKNHKRPEFDVTLRAENPNKRLSVSYKGGLEEASLVYKNKKIGQGKIRPTVGDDLLVMMAGNAAALSPEIEKSLNGTMEKSMTMMMEVVIEMKSWVRNESKNLKISCDFKVKNSLANNNKISFQECLTEF